jgi:hypothetical protein
MSVEVDRREVRAAGRLFREMLTAGALYAGAVAAAAWAIRSYDLPQWAAALIAIAPTAPALLMLRAQLRHMRSQDEFQRRLQSEAILIAAAIVAFGTLTYGLLEDLAGFPDVSLLWVFPIFCMLWSAATVILHLRYR